MKSTTNSSSECPIIARFAYTPCAVFSSISIFISGFLAFLGVMLTPPNSSFAFFNSIMPGQAGTVGPRG